MSNPEFTTTSRQGEPGAAGVGSAVVDPRRLLDILRRRWLWVLIPPLVLAGLGGASAALQPNRYEATAVVAMQPTAAQDRLSGGRSNALAERELQTQERLLNGPSMEATVEAQLGGEVSFKAGAIEGTDLIEIEAEAPTAELAASAADSIAARFVAERRGAVEADLEKAAAELQDKITDLEEQLADVDATGSSRARASLNVDQPEGTGSAVVEAPALSRRRSRLEHDLEINELALEELHSELALTEGNVRLAAAAIPPTERTSPNPRRSVVLWAMLGLLLGLGLAWFRDVRDRRIRTVADVSLPGGGPDVVGLLHRPDIGSFIGPVSLLVDDVADRFRALSANTLTDDQEGLAIQVCGVRGGEGATFTAANLATVMAAGGWATVVVDADLAGGDLHRVFGIEVAPGIKHLLDGGPLTAVITTTTQVYGLGVIPRGSERSADASLHNARLTELIDQLRQRFDMVIFDSPPILRPGDASVLAAHVDKTIVVAAAGVTTMPDLADAVHSVAVSGGRVGAVALTDSSDKTMISPEPKEANPDGAARVRIAPEPLPLPTVNGDPRSIDFATKTGPIANSKPLDTAGQPRVRRTG